MKRAVYRYILSPNKAWEHDRPLKTVGKVLNGLASLDDSHKWCEAIGVKCMKCPLNIFTKPRVY